MKLSACAALLAAGIMLAGCGQKGPLFLPGNPSEIRSEVPRVPDEDAREDDDRDDEDRDAWPANEQQR